MLIRPMSPEDLPALRLLYEKSWRWAYRDLIPQSFLDGVPKEAWAGGVTKEGRQNLVLEEAGALLGTVSFCPSRWWKYPDYGEIVALYLLPEHTGQGWGRLLLGRAVAALGDQGLEKVLLWVLKDNRRARAFYEKYGFVPKGDYQESTYDGQAVGEVLYTYGDEPPGAGLYRRLW